MMFESIIAREGVPLPPAAGPARTSFCIDEGLRAAGYSAEARWDAELALLELRFLTALPIPDVLGIAEVGDGSLVHRAGERRVEQWFAFRDALLENTRRSPADGRPRLAPGITGENRRRIRAQWIRSRFAVIARRGDDALTQAKAAFHWFDDASRDLAPETVVIHDDVEVGTIGELRARAHETVHVLGDLLGGLIGCRFTHRDGHWIDQCRVALLHIPIANSVGFTSRRACTICRSDVADCEHEPGTTYRTTAGRTPEGLCTVCGLETCDHQIGETVDAVATFALADLVLREVSLVKRPRDPLCRISGREVDEQELIRLLGRAPRPEDVLLDHRCMHQCDRAETAPVSPRRDRNTRLDRDLADSDGECLEYPRRRRSV